MNKKTVEMKDPILVPVWDLSDLYESLKDKKIEEDLLNLLKLKDKFILYKTTVQTMDAEHLTYAIKEFENISELTAKLGCFAYLHKAKNSSDSTIAIFYQNLVDRLSKIESELIFFSLEIDKIEEEKLNTMIDENPTLTHYKSWFKKILKFKKHTLGDEGEQILHLKSITSSQMLVRLFDEIHADMKFPFKEKMLSNSDIFDQLNSNNKEDRRIAAESISKTLGANSKNLTMIMNMIAKDKAIEDDLRKFESTMSARNLINDIEDEVVTNLIDTVKSYYPKTSHRYYKLKAKWMGQNSLNYWDRNAPLSESSSRKFSWNEAKEIVLRSYNQFSPKMADEARKFFDHQWIDAQISDGKASGAFCHPCVPSIHPYMLMNFGGKVSDIMTLSHELGHCVHYMFSKKNGYLCSDIPLTLAETASVFGEQLTFRYLLSLELEPKERKYLIAKKVEDMLNTVVRQIAFCDFEREVHGQRLKSELSNDDICDIWMKLQKEVLGDAITLNDDYRPYWSYISHFIHAPFYVYSYAFGDCLVNSLYKNYIDNQHSFAEKYLNLLGTGGLIHHKELLKPFNIDLTNKDFWKSGLSVIEELIDELEKIN